MRTSRLLVLLLALMLALGAGSAAPAGDAKAKPKVVGGITAIGGTKNVKIRPLGATKAVRARAGTRIPRGATIVMGKGATATLRLKRPAGLPQSAVLVSVRSAAGAKHTSTVTRGARGILVRIAPS